MNRNIYHLYAAISTGLMFLFWFIVMWIGVVGQNLAHEFTDGFAIWTIFSLLYIANIATGLLQLKFDTESATRYVAYFTIFVPFAFFPTVANTLSYLRSGLSKDNAQIEAKKWVVDNLVTFENALAAANHNLSANTIKKIDTVTSLQQAKALDTSGGNAFKLELIEKEIPFESWPQIWDIKEIIERVNNFEFKGQVKPLDFKKNYEVAIKNTKLLFASIPKIFTKFNIKRKH